MVVVKSSVQIVTCPQEWATYTSIKAWLLAVEDWVLSNTHITPKNLGPAIIHAMLDICSWFKSNFPETCKVLGRM